MNQYAGLTVAQLKSLRDGEMASRAAAKKVKDGPTRRHLVGNHDRIIKAIMAELRRRS